MPSPMTAARRLSRAVTGAALSTFVALASHVIAGGAMPSAPGLVVPLLLSTAVCFQLAGKELSLWRLSVAVLVSQWLFHQLFVVGAGGVGVASSGGVHAGHDVGSITVQGSAHSHGGAGMTLAHIVAAAVTVTALFKAEQLLATLATGASRLNATMRATAWMATLSLLLAPPRAVHTATPAATVEGWGESARPLDAASSPVSRRGPPVLHS